MACPNCGCKETYEFNDLDDVEGFGIQRCAACGSTFYLDDEIPEDD